MANDTRLSLNPQFIIGLGLIVFGGLLTLDRMELVDAARSLRYWPVVLIVLGAWMAIERRRTGRSFPGYVMLTIGSLLLLDAMGVVRVRFWELFWPVILMAVGAKLIMQTPGQHGMGRWLFGMSNRHTDATPEGATIDGTVNMFSVFGSDRRATNDRIFRGGDVTSIFSGTQLDLRQAAIEPGNQAVINVFLLMGGHELWVPQGWTVVIEVMPILGGVDDKRLPPVLNAATATAAAPRLVLRGMVVMGGLTIKN